MLNLDSDDDLLTDFKKTVHLVINHIVKIYSNIWNEYILFLLKRSFPDAICRYFSSHISSDVDWEGRSTKFRFGNPFGWFNKMLLTLLSLWCHTFSVGETCFGLKALPSVNKPGGNSPFRISSELLHSTQNIQWKSSFCFHYSMYFWRLQIQS